MNKDLLLRLADLLEKDAADPAGIKFSLSVWGVSDPKEKPRLSCGTRACAMGLAALSGEFEGLSFKSFPDDVGREHIEVVYRDALTGFDAARDLFQITYLESEYLFNDQSYIGLPIYGAKGELAVAKRIREFVETGRIKR